MTVIKNDSNLGYGGNQKLGYKYFIEKGYDVVVLLHGDGQYAPEILRHPYAPLVAGQADAVHGAGHCGEGFFAQDLVREGNEVVGIDMLREPRHRSLLAHYVQADLDQGLGEALPALSGRRFDRVLLQDVVEHVRNPQKLVTDCQRLLTEQGLLLLSVPNVANIVVRLSLLIGRFEYAERGILDKTHLRFFTRSSARRLLEKAGDEIIAEKTSVMPVELALGLPAGNWLMRVTNSVLAFFTRLFPRLLGYQLLYAARSRLNPEHAHLDQARAQAVG